MLRLIQILVGALPGTLRRHVPTRHLPVIAQFLQFGMVGTVGFVVDTAIVYALRAPAGLYIAGVVAYAGAVTTTWWVNRVWTFRGLGKAHTMRHQWARYAVANIPGLLLNLGSYFALVAGSRLCATYPVIAVAAGAIAGMFANFILSRAVVFR